MSGAFQLRTRDTPSGQCLSTQESSICCGVEKTKFQQNLIHFKFGYTPDILHDLFEDVFF